jgi:hypothetical protein
MAVVAALPTILSFVVLASSAVYSAKAVEEEMLAG